MKGWEWACEEGMRVGPAVMVLSQLGRFDAVLLVEKLLCILRDGRKLIGYLRSIDQFGRPETPGSVYPHRLCSDLSASPPLFGIQQTLCCSTLWSEFMSVIAMGILSVESTSSEEIT